MADSTPTSPWLSFFQLILSWQIVVLILFFSLRKVIVGLFNKERLKIKAGSFEVDLSKSAQEQSVKYNEEKSVLDKATSFFREETIKHVQGYVQNETGYNTLQSDKEKFEALLKYSTAIYIISSFQRTYDLILGSQIYLLQNLNSNGGISDQGIIEYHYNNAKTRFPEAYEKFPIEDWAAFLYNSNLMVKLKSNDVEITTIGIDFLKFLTDTKKNLYKNY